MSEVKLSAADVRSVLAEVPGTMRKLAAERDFFRDKCVEYQSRERVEKIATSMIEKGLREGSVASVADDLQKQASAGDVDLDVFEQAVKLTGPNMGKHASVSDELSGAGAVSEFERFTLS